MAKAKRSKIHRDTRSASASFFRITTPPFHLVSPTPPFWVVPPSDCLSSISQTIVSVKPKTDKNSRSLRRIPGAAVFFMSRFYTLSVENYRNILLNTYQAQNSPIYKKVPSILCLAAVSRNTRKTQSDSQNWAF